MEQKECTCDCAKVMRGNPDFRLEIGGIQCQCPHHTSQNSGDWEAEFDRVFLETMYKDSGYSEEREDIKRFFRLEIDRAERRVKESLREKAKAGIRKIENPYTRYKERRNFEICRYKIEDGVLNLL